MTEEIATNLFRIETPLPLGELQSINSYIIKSKDRNLLIDTGLGTDDCVTSMEKSLKELGVDIKKTDFFITHCHRDHFGLLPRLIQKGSIIYIDRLEAETIEKINSGAIENEVISFVRITGFPENKLKDVFSSLPRRVSRAGISLPFKFLDDGDIINIEGYHFKCVKTPGHSNGHICLYEPSKKILIAGDHILSDITPGIQARFNDKEPLSDYLNSLDIIYKLDIEVVLPGHRDIFRNHKERINEIRIHHEKRNQEVLAILQEGSRNAYQIASRMTWNVDCDSWESFPLLQQFFATGEAFAHLKFLAEKKKVKHETHGRTLMYSLADK